MNILFLIGIYREPIETIQSFWAAANGSANLGFQHDAYTCPCGRTLWYKQAKQQKQTYALHQDYEVRRQAGHVGHGRGCGHAHLMASRVLLANSVYTIPTIHFNNLSLLH